MHAAPSFEQLYRRHYDFVWRSALRLGVGPASLDDVVQETFLVAYRRREEFEGRSKPSTWLFSILVNVCRNHRRGRQRADRKHLALAQVHSALEPAAHSGTELSAQRGLAIRLLAEFLVELDEPKREVFVLAELEGMRGPEIAAALELNRNTMHARLRAARKAFERRFEPGSAVPVLCETLRREPPAGPPEQRARSRALILAALGPAESGAAASLGLGAWVWGLVGGLALGGLALAGGVLAWQLSSSGGDTQGGRGEQRADPSRAATRPAAAAPPVEADLVEPAAIVVEPPVAAVSDPKPSERARRAPRRSEAEIFEAARRAMLDGHARKALALARSLDARGELAWERAVTEVGALCVLGREAEAEALASDWNRADHGLVIEAACW